MASHPTVGVEEEFLLVDPDTGEPVARNEAVADHADARGVELQLELTSCQVETTTDVLTPATNCATELTRLRRIAADAAEARRARLLAVGLPPTVPHEFPITDTPRYREIAERFGMIAHEQGICGCHVHVAVPGPRRRDPGEQPAAAVAAAAAGADRQLGGLPQHRHRLRQLAQHAVAALAERGPAAALRIRRRVRRRRPDAAATAGADARRRDGLLGCAPVGRTSRRSRCASPTCRRPWPRRCCWRRWSGAA